MNIEQIAKVFHATNMAYCQTIGDDSQKPWKQAAQWQRDSAIDGVKFSLENPHALASAQHDAWANAKFKAGWKYGPVKDEAKKEHPCMVEYDLLPIEQRVKDHLFKAIVRAFAEAERTA